MQSPRRNLLLAGIVVGAAFAASLGGLAFGSELTNGSQQGNSTNMPAAGPNRPANVPDGYVITPFGYFHQSCVQSLVRGERLLPDGRLQHADGTVEEQAAVCIYPHYMRNGLRSNAGSANTSRTESSNTESNLPSINGWVESANIYTGSPTKSYGALIATWTVPPQPAADDGQVLYFFPGLEDLNDVQSILQPVLQWYQGQWAVASWNCCLNGIVTESPVVNVAPRDEIFGSITSTCPAGTLTCPTWNVLSADLSTGDSTTLSNTPSAGQTFNWAFGGVLEAYYVVSCDDYPRDRKLSFDRVTVFDQSLRPVFDPEWSGSGNSTGTPQCDYSLKLSRRTVTVDY